MKSISPEVQRSKSCLNWSPVAFPICSWIQINSWRQSALITPKFMHKSGHIMRNMPADALDHLIIARSMLSRLIMHKECRRPWYAPCNMLYPCGPPSHSIDHHTPWHNVREKSIEEGCMGLGRRVLVRGCAHLGLRTPCWAALAVGQCLLAEPIPSLFSLSLLGWASHWVSHAS